MAAPLEYQRWFDWILLGVAMVAVAVADVFLKRAASPGDLGLATRSPWFWAAIGLYLLQLMIFAYAFVTGWRLSLIGALQENSLIRADCAWSRHHPVSGSPHTHPGHGRRFGDRRRDRE